MTASSSGLEILPNEILFVIFRYFNARDLFRAFYNLNIRFNQLIQSFNELQLVFQVQTSADKGNIFPFYVYTLIVNSGIDVNLNHFPNIRRLKIDSIPNNSLSQSNLPYLEHLTLSHAGM
jgi:hypothetical protein